MNFKLKKEILDLFQENELLWATSIAEKLWKNRVTIHKYLKKFFEEWKIKKIGKWAHTKYKNTSVIKTKNQEFKKMETDKMIFLDFKKEKTLNEIFFKFSPDWRILKWFSWIKEWCDFRNLNTKEKIDNYIKIFNHIESLQNDCWLVSAKKVFWTHFEKNYLDDIFYADQYKWMEFWRWKLAEMTFYAKQSQNKKLISSSISEIILKLKCVILKWNFDAIAITPWSIDRKNQLLHFLKKELNFLWLPFVNIVKYYPNNIPIPQKSLKSREQRIQNARNTIFIDDKNIKKYSKVFLIDDFVWSGSTLNETACKLKEEWIKHVYWFAFVWNLDLKYEIINEV